MRTAIELLIALGWFIGLLIYSLHRPKSHFIQPDPAPPEKTGLPGGNSHQRRLARRRQERAAKIGKA
jgi:hypothetical protein